MSGISESNCVVAYSQLKDAALYFDYVVPFPGEVLYSEFESLIFRAAKGEANALPTKEAILGQVELTIPREPTRLLPPTLKDDDDFRKRIAHIGVWQCFSSIVSLINSLAPPDVSAKMEEIAQRVNTQLQIDVRDSAALALAREAFLKQYGLTQLPAILSTTYHSNISQIALETLREHMPDVFADENSTGIDNKEPSAEAMCGLTLADLRLIDTSKVEWDHLFKFREDEASRKKLNRLRNFFITSYEGKSRAHIESHLRQCLDDYEETARAWGFDTMWATLEAFGKSPSMVAASSAFLTLMLTGQGNMAALGAGGLSFAGLTLSFGSELYKRHMEVNRHPLGYIIEARKLA